MKTPNVIIKNLEEKNIFFAFNQRKGVANLWFDKMDICLEVSVYLLSVRLTKQIQKEQATVRREKSVGCIFFPK